MRISRLCCVAGISLLVLAAFCGVSRAQTTTAATVSGQVTDPQGKVVPAVTVVFTNINTGVPSSTQTNGDGIYSLPTLQPGIYRANVTRDGFKSIVKSDIELHVQDQASINFALELGSVSETVTVSGPAPLVDTERTEMGEVITGSHMTAMPLNGRSFTDLLALQPGVVPVSSEFYASPSPSGELNPGNLSVSGQREAANGFIVNGGNVNEATANGTAIVPDLDSIAEFRIQTNNFDAASGNYSGGLVNVVTKSGTNQFHGDVFEFLRNPNLDARNFYSGSRAVLHRNQFGGTIGGPIRRDKVFFFADYQGTREVQGLDTGLIPVPSQADRAGNLSDVSSQLTRAVTGPFFANSLSQELGYPVSVGEPYYASGCTTSSQCVFPNAVIPQSVISGPAAALMKYIPEANVAGGFFSTSAYPQTLRDDKWSYRTDANTGWGMLSAYYSFDDYSLLNPYSADNLPGFTAGFPGRGPAAYLGRYKIHGPQHGERIAVELHADVLVQRPARGWRRTDAQFLWHRRRPFGSGGARSGRGRRAPCGPQCILIRDLSMVKGTVQ